MDEIIEKIQQAVAILDEIDEKYENLPNEQSENDMAVSDLYHFIETMSLSSKSAYRIIKALKERLIRRRIVKQQYDLLKIYNDNKGKLINKGNRAIMLNTLKQQSKNLDAPYKNRVYTEEELKQMEK